MTRRLVAMPDPELLDPLRTALEAQDLNAFTELLCPDVAWGDVGTLPEDRSGE